jgi:hypothetical protein
MFAESERTLKRNLLASLKARSCRRALLFCIAAVIPLFIRAKAAKAVYNHRILFRDPFFLFINLSSNITYLFVVDIKDVKDCSSLTPFYKVFLMIEGIKPPPFPISMQ